MYTTNLYLENAIAGKSDEDLLQLSLVASANENGVVFNNNKGDKWLPCPNQSTNKPPSKMKEDQLYDLTSLKAISRGNEAFVQKMVNIFCDETPVMVKEIEEGIKSGKLDKMRETAHKMKPSIDNLNIVPLKQLIRDIELIEKDSFDEKRMIEKVDQLKHTIKLVIDKIRVEYPG
jgi:HPt (histidine-containing phosphotransfer) domain-containing protein